MQNIKKLILFSLFINYAHIAIASEEQIFGETALPVSNEQEEAFLQATDLGGCHEENINDHKAYGEQSETDPTVEQNSTMENYKASDEKRHPQEN